MAGLGLVPTFEPSDGTPSDHSDDFDLTEHRRALASRAYQQGTQFVSIDVVLKELNLSHYLDDFLQADADMIENYVHRSDDEVEDILRNVEVVNRFKFPYVDRIRLWKSLRCRWFGSPDFAKSFVHTAEIPELILSKKDFRVRDTKIDLKLLDSERQRMVTRKTVFDEIEGTTVIQEEVYKRQSPLFYELLGLERTIQFWVSQDPRKMSREDPREEVFLTQMKSIELKVATLIDELKIKRKIKRIVLKFFFVLKFIFSLMSVVFLIVAIVDANASDSTKPATEVFYSSSLLRCSALYLCTFFFIFEITKQRQKISNYDLAKKMHAKCRFMYNDMISFRLKTHHVRQQILLRYVDEAKIVEEPERRPNKSSRMLVRKHAMVIPDSAYDEYIGTGVLSADQMRNIVKSQSVLDLPPGDADRLPKRAVDSVWDARMERADEINQLLTRTPPLVAMSDESSSDEYDENDGLL